MAAETQSATAAVLGDCVAVGTGEAGVHSTPGAVLLVSVAANPPQVLDKYHMPNWVRAVAVSHDRTTVFSGDDDGNLMAYDLRGKKTRKVVEAAHGNWIASLAVGAGDQLLLSASSDHTVKLWDLAAHHFLALLQTFDHHSSYVRAVAFNADGSFFASCGEDKKLNVYRRRKGSMQIYEHLTYQLKGWSALAFDPSNKNLLAAALWKPEENRKIFIYDCTNGSVVRELDSGHSSEIHSIAYGFDTYLTRKTLLTAAWDFTAKEHDVANGKALHGSKQHSNWVYGAVYYETATHLDTKVVTASFDNTLKVWNHDGKEECSLNVGHHLLCLASFQQTPSSLSAPASPSGFSSSSSASSPSISSALSATHSPTSTPPGSPTPPRASLSQAKMRRVIPV